MNRRELDNIADALVENVLDTSDEDILREVEEDHGDPQFIANKMRSIITCLTEREGSNE